VHREEQQGVVGPDGRRMTIHDLPDPKLKRWVPQRKAEVVAAVNGGLLTLTQACERYGISVEEFESWARSIRAFGVKGLRTTRTQQYKSLTT
jgi:transposase-like protein